MIQQITRLIIAAFITQAFVQADLAETYVQPDEFEIAYPTGWQVTADETNGFVSVSQANLQLTLYSPTILAAYGLDNYNPATLTSLILELNAVTGQQTQLLDLGGRESAISSYNNPNTGYAGLLIARPFKDGTIGLIDAHGSPDAMQNNEDLILQIAATFDLPPVTAPTMLEKYLEPWPQAIAELEASGLIAAGGELAFAERYVFAAGNNRTQPLAQALSLRDVVMGGGLTYTPSANAVNESCGLIARRMDESTRLEIGVNSSGNLYVVQNTDNPETLQADLVDTTASYRVLFAALNDRLLVYLNGELVTDREIRVQEGHFAIRVQGDGPGATCEVTDLWVYRVPVSVETGVCDITATSGAVNKRSGPGTNFDIAGILDDGANLPAITQATESDSLTWWQLSDGSWVREDVVSEAGACRALPVAE